MRRAAMVVLGLVLALPLVVQSEEATPPSTAPPPPTTPTTPPAEAGPPVQETIAKGTLPDDLAGRWFVLAWLKTPQGAVKTTFSFWNVTQGADGVELTERWVEMPEPWKTQLVNANANDTKWEPTAADITQLGAAWSDLVDRDPQIAQAKHEVVGKDAFDRDFTNEPKTAKADWVVRQRFDFRRSAAPTARQINVFGVMERTDTGYAGNYTTATIAASFIPIPIKLDGTFGIYRLAGGEASTKTSGGLFGFFSGCGK